MSLNLIVPDWPAPPGVKAISTTRQGGVSQGPYASLNLGMNCGDAEDRVAENRHRLETHLGAEFFWLQQCHGTRSVEAGGTDHDADACWTARPGLACAILSADCLPVLFCHREQALVAAVHAGWRGLAAGVIESCLERLPCQPEELMAWLGPCIGPGQFEVGDEVRAAFVAGSGADAACFSPSAGGRWLADLPALATARLNRAGVSEIYGGRWCTVSDPDRFFSYRRDTVTGRIASGIWLACE